jgi:hypothetical protein
MESDQAKAVEPAGWRQRWLTHLGSKQVTHGVYAEIVVLAVIVVIEGHPYSDAGIVTSVVGALVTVLLAELYAEYIGMMMRVGHRPSWSEFKPNVIGASGGLIATALPILLVMLGVAGVIRLDAGFTAAKWAGAAVIGLYSYVANRRAGLSVRKSLVAASVFLFIGVVLVLFKQYVH